MHNFLLLLAAQTFTSSNESPLSVMNSGREWKKILHGAHCSRSLGDTRTHTHTPWESWHTPTHACSYCIGYITTLKWHGSAVSLISLRFKSHVCRGFWKNIKLCAWVTQCLCACVCVSVTTFVPCLLDFHLNNHNTHTHTHTHTNW